FTLKNAAWDGIYRSVVPAALRRGIRHSISNSPLINATLRRKMAHTFLARDGKHWPSFYFDNFFSAFDRNEQEDLLSEQFATELSEGSAYRHVLGHWENSSGDMLQ